MLGMHLGPAVGGAFFFEAFGGRSGDTALGPGGALLRPVLTRNCHTFAQDGHAFHREG